MIRSHKLPLIRLYWFILFLQLFLALIVTAVYFLDFSAIIRNESHGLIIQDLKAQSTYLRLIVNKPMFDNSSEIDSQLKSELIRISQLNDRRLTFISPSGKVTFDSHHDVKTMENHADRVEIIAAGQSPSGYSIRFSETLKMDMIYYATAFYNQNKIEGFIRISVPYDIADKTISNLMKRLRVSSLLLFLLISIVASFAAKILSRTMRKIATGTTDIAKGSYNVKFPIIMIREIDEMIQAIKRMSKAIQRQMKRIESQNKELQELTMIDELTNLGNRRKFDYYLEYLWEFCRRERHPMSMIIMDIDLFKKFNDSLGHPKGDECLKQLSRILKQSIKRSTDILVRLGGEEFAVLLPNSEEQDALRIARMVQKNLTEGAIPHPDSTVSSFVTMSLGVVTLFPETGREKTFLFEYADQALFEAKRSGRNRINVYTSGLKKPGQ